MIWTSIRSQRPPLWKWVNVKSHAQEEFYYQAYRTFFGKWKFRSGFKGTMDQHNMWSFISTYTKN